MPGVGLGLFCYAALDYGVWSALFVGTVGAFIGVALMQPGVSAGRVLRGTVGAIAANNAGPFLEERILKWGFGDPPQPSEVSADRVDQSQGVAGPYTEDDFPFPDSVPGRAAQGPTDGPVPFAVVSPGEACEGDLREIGRRLKAWQDADSRVLEIIGLEQLLAGQFPETPAWYLMLSTPPETERVALVLVSWEAATEATTDELTVRLRGCPVGMIVSPDYYRAINS